MFALDFGGYKKDQYKEHVRSLEEACEWLGIAKGRAPDYAKLIREFYEENGRTRDHILAYNESCEITDIYRFWQPKLNEFPGLKRKIADVLGSGPVVREDEKAETSSNRPRNEAFVYYLAGWLLGADVQLVAVDGVLAEEMSGPRDSDISFVRDSEVVDIECKRPRSVNALEDRVKEARRQITKPARNGRNGVIAVDCSVVIRPPEKLLEVDSPEKANKFLSTRLQELAIPGLLKEFERGILGFLLFARVPLMTRIGQSPLVPPSGGALTYFRRDSCCSFVLITNNSSANPELFRSIFQNVREP